MFIQQQHVELGEITILV